MDLLYQECESGCWSAASKSMGGIDIFTQKLTASLYPASLLFMKIDMTEEGTKPISTEIIQT